MRTIIGIIVSIVFVAAGLYTLMVWEAGSHGHIRFRPWMLEEFLPISC